MDKLNEPIPQIFSVSELVHDGWAIRYALNLQLLPPNQGKDLEIHHDR